jgi:hypothetical protein
MARLVHASLVCLWLSGCYAAHGGLEGRDGGRTRGDGAVRPADASVPIDAGAPAACAPQDARQALCPGAVCDGPGTWHWNGDDCHYVECGACEGADCDRGWSFQLDCIAAHRSCEPSLCRETGGEWRFWSDECEHWECGSPAPVNCLVGRPVCDCGLDRRFDPERGCVDAWCPPRELFTPEERCVATGGAWAPICCDTECGRYCPEPCAFMACDCGPLRVFDESRGCREAERCFEPRRDEACSSRTRCERGTTCCGGGEAARCTSPVCVGGAICGDTPGG